MPTLPIGSSSELQYLLYALVALGVFLLFTGVAQLLRRGETTSESRSRRMRLIAKGATTAELLELLKPKSTSEGFARLPFVGGLPKLLLQAGLTITAPRFLFLCALASVAIFVAAASQVSPPKALLLAIALGIGLPYALVRSKRDRRIKALTHQLPDALDLLARGLRVGHPLNTSIGTVAQEMPDPIGTEFGIIFDQISFGEELVDAFQEMSERVDIEDVHYLAASVGIQHGTGGDLARVIQVLSNVIRDRIAMRRRIKAISSEGRLTAWFLSALPFFIFGFTNFTNPTYYSGVADDPLFKPMVVAIVFFVVANALILKKLVNFRI